MIGFGFMDNFVMIQAGQYIDSTLGVTLGLATLTAAAAGTYGTNSITHDSTNNTNVHTGQVVSDVSGVVFGGSLERLLSRYAMVPHITLSSAQRRLPIAQNVAMLGAVCGVVLGCTIGAVVGLFSTDVAQKEREQRDQEITTILIQLLRDHGTDWRLYLPKHSLFVDDSNVTTSKQQLRPLEDDPLAQQCMTSSKKSNLHTRVHSISPEKTEYVYIPVGEWAVLRCRAEVETEGDLLARHLSILFQTLLRSKP